MYLPNKKDKPWKTKDYVLTILQFFIHAIVITGLMVGMILLYAGSGEAFVKFFTERETILDFVYLVMFIIAICASLYLYLFREFKDFMLQGKNIAVIFIIMELSLIVSVVSGEYIGIYARPVAFCALLVLLLVNKRTAIFVGFSFNLLVFVADIFTNHTISPVDATVSLLICCCTGIFAIYLVDEVGSRIKVFLRGFIISVPVIVIALAVELEPGILFEKILLIILHGFMGGMTSVVYMMAILPIFEAMFNMITDYRLAEITDHKSKLIKRMIETAGGTFNHSMVVASLAESCATAIGENPLLARAAAYYHDIGKLKQPIYFTENQHGYNPHDDLTPELSTEIIRSHTKDGYDLIKKYHLPSILADVAREHHGTLPIQYFYAKALKYTEGDLDIADFSYQGPKPHSKIAAIIMLADGCEAAVRAQNDRSRDKVEKIVESIIADRMKREQFSECEITMREIDLIREALENGLSGVYHDRINYPKLNNRKVNAFGSVSGGGKSSDTGDKTGEKKD